jgi:ABC-type bacteriocin/lantibiotic exporter with double-glycine peptidase domain
LIQKLRDRWALTTIGRSSRVLSRTDQRKTIAVALLQIGLGALDLMGVAAAGVLGALAVSGVQSSEPGNRVNAILTWLNLENASFQTQAAVIGLAAAVLLIGRTLLSVFFTRRTLYFLSRRGAVISANLISRLLKKPLLTIQERTTQETLYAVTYGVDTVMLRILGVTVTLIADISLLTVMAIGLFVVDPVIAFSTFAVFSAIGFILYKLMYIRARDLGLQFSQLAIVSNEKIIEVLGSYRESVVRNRRDYYSREIGKLQLNLAETTAEMSFMPNISKYVIETTVVLGSLLIGASQFLLQDAVHAVATLSVFLAAGSRIAPAVLRVQQGSVTIRGNLGIAGPTLDLIESLGDNVEIENFDDNVDIKHEGFQAEIEVSDVTLTYPTKSNPAVSGVSLQIPQGKSVALVGTSGAGKTTIIDVILGVLIPDQGSVKISGMPPLAAFSKWPGAVSYVPQDIVISNGTIRENVALGFPIQVATDELVLDALRVAHLDEFVAGLPNGLDTPVGERGAKISGGQRQRLGIARAMFTKPKLLVLDEATSSLDGETEASISEAIYALRGSTTVVFIAHRLSTVRNADIVIYLSEGKVIASGTFEEVRDAVPDFDRQAKSMGL